MTTELDSGFMYRAKLSTTSHSLQQTKEAIEGSQQKQEILFPGRV